MKRIFRDNDHHMSDSFSLLCFTTRDGATPEVSSEARRKFLEFLTSRAAKGHLAVVVIVVVVVVDRSPPINSLLF